MIKSGFFFINGIQILFYSKLCHINITREIIANNKNTMTFGLFQIKLFVNRLRVKVNQVCSDEELKHIGEIHY